MEQNIHQQALEDGIGREGIQNEYCIENLGTTFDNDVDDSSTMVSLEEMSHISSDIEEGRDANLRGQIEIVDIQERHGISKDTKYDSTVALQILITSMPLLLFNFMEFSGDSISQRNANFSFFAYAVTSVLYRQALKDIRNYMIPRGVSVAIQISLGILTCLPILITAGSIVLILLEYNMTVILAMLNPFIYLNLFAFAISVKIIQRKADELRETLDEGVNRDMVPTHIMVVA